MIWQLTPDSEPETNLERATKVEVRFEEDEGGGRRVSLEHRGFEAYDESGAKMRSEVGSEGGWPALMKALRGGRPDSRRKRSAPRPAR
jgi:uncharacterized protein YndB with AHSA1/START domain